MARQNRFRRGRGDPRFFDRPGARLLRAGRALSFPPAGPRKPAEAERRRVTLLTPPAEASTEEDKR